jgi:hypothetical protein
LKIKKLISGINDTELLQNNNVIYTDAPVLNGLNKKLSEALVSGANFIRVQDGKDMTDPKLQGIS